MTQTETIHDNTRSDHTRSDNTKVLHYGKEICHISSPDNNKPNIEMSTKLATISEISNWIVTIVQACSTTLVGIYVVIVCACKEEENDIIYGCRCRLVEIYLWVLWSYFVSDILRLHKIHEIKNNNVTRMGNASFISQGKHICGIEIFLDTYRYIILIS